jgi:hypothetical protein
VIKVDLLDACIALRVVDAVNCFPLVLALNLHNPPANGNQGLISKGNLTNPADQ